MNAMTTKLGRLLTESVADIEPSTLESNPTLHRPLRTPLLNDGRHHYWMVPGERYRINRDERGWRVTCSTWDASHAYYLASPRTWEPVGQLPTDAGSLVLRNPGATYVLEPVDASSWVLLMDCEPV